MKVRLDKSVFRTVALTAVIIFTIIGCKNPIGPKSGAVEGYVKNSSGKGISGASVKTGDVSAKSDSSGYYSLELDNGDYTLTASKGGYVPAKKTASVGQSGFMSCKRGMSEVNFVLTLVPDGGGGGGGGGETVPSAPTNLKANPISYSQINLTWDEPQHNEKGFKFERKTGATGTYAQIATMSFSTTFVYSDKNLSAGTTYCYRMKSYNGAGDSGYSNEASATTFINTDKADMVLVPAGTFIMGDDNPLNMAADERPQHTVYLNAFQIDKYEVTNARYKVFIDAGGYSNSAYWTTEGWNWKISNNITALYDWDRGSNNSGPSYPNYPVGGVSWYEACAFAKWAGKRLPTEAEWEKAARGTDGRTYPWGEGFDSSKANHTTGVSTQVGSYPSGASPYGCMDMAGNVEEWCNDWYYDGYYSMGPSNNPQGPTVGYLKVLRGGSWDNSNPYSSDMRCAKRNCPLPSGIQEGDPTIGLSVSGFRCVK